MARIATFDDWVDYFRQWQNELGLDPAMFKDYAFETKFGDIPTGGQIEFGDYAGRPRWETVLQIPDQRVRDALLHLIVYQGDTEFASSEQQRHLLQNSPSEHDLKSAMRVMREEMRHGWQMAYLLVRYFGRTGRLEARKLLERRADQKTRLLSTFNQEVHDWLDFYCYTALVDRDGKYQLRMLSHSSFAPLAASMTPMLDEEFYHLLTGYTGLSRVLRAGKVPVEIVQKHINRWFSSALDLFGVDNSSAASWFYVWGLKGRFNEDVAEHPADRNHLNEEARAFYAREVRDLVDALNKLIPEGQPQLYLPDAKFNRTLGEHAGTRHDVRGELLSAEALQTHLKTVLPTPEDKSALRDIFKEKDWIMSVG